MHLISETGSTLKPEVGSNLPSSFITLTTLEKDRERYIYGGGEERGKKGKEIQTH